MRISDWSSDVCSSDVGAVKGLALTVGFDDKDRGIEPGRMSSEAADRKFLFRSSHGDVPFRDCWGSAVGKADDVNNPSLRGWIAVQGHPAVTKCHGHKCRPS